MWREIKKIIHQNDDFVITTHINPDGDGVGAATALVELLLKMGKRVRFVCDSVIPEKFRFLDYHGLFQEYHPNIDFRGVQVLLVLDAHRKDRIGQLIDLAEDPNVVSVCIDHHNISETFTPYLAIDPLSCSVGAMVYTLYKECGYELNKNSATGIYASILCDTGRFSYSSTSRKAHKVADECIKLGVDPDSMYSHLFEHVTLGQFRVFLKAMQRMETHLDNRVVVQRILREDYEGIGEEAIDIEHIDLEYIHELSKRIDGVECAVILHELPDDRVRISLRSKSNLDISQLMESLGGGGHQRAAGAVWNGSLPEVKELLLNSLDEMLKSKKETQLV